jgi:hypothetical protein
MNSSDEFFIRVQHSKQFGFDDRRWNSDLLSSSSINQIIKKFESVFLVWSMILIISERCVHWRLKNLLVDLIDRVRVDTEIRIDVDLNDKLFSFYDVKFYSQISGRMHISDAMIDRYQVIETEVDQKFR